ncbi:hypothetical protein GQX74_003464 [Glossina fuscipes]|nr:hypothetical protein GQX74_003464 [Glossina fuscipes]
MKSLSNSTKHKSTVLITFSSVLPQSNSPNVVSSLDIKTGFRGCTWISNSRLIPSGGEHETELFVGGEHWLCSDGGKENGIEHSVDSIAFLKVAVVAKKDETKNQQSWI